MSFLDKLKTKLKKTDAKEVAKTGGLTAGDAAAAFAGGFAGSAIGWHSLYTGFLLMYLGRYAETNMLSAFGAGMFASVPLDMMVQGGSGASTTVQGLNGEKGIRAFTEAGKIRARAYREAFARKIHLDKLKKKSGAAMDGLGYASGMAQLDSIEQSLVAEAMDFQHQPRYVADPPEMAFQSRSPFPNPTVFPVDGFPSGIDFDSF